MDHIIKAIIIMPKRLDRDYNFHIFTTFNLGNNLTQMFYFRSYNEFECFKEPLFGRRWYSASSCLPTIYKSGIILLIWFAIKKGVIHLCIK